jgi:hypothetical protein
MAWAQVDQFVTLARRKKGNVDTDQEGTLYPLIQILRAPGQPTLHAVRTAVNAFPAKTQDKYKEALDFLRTNFPGLAGAGPLPGVTAAQLQGAIGRQTHVTAAQQVAPAAAPAPMGAVAVAGTVQPDGWSLINDPSPFTPYAGGDQAGPLTNVEVQRVNEAVRRTKRAIEVAIQELSQLRPPGAPAPNTPAGRYARFFGPLTTAVADTTRKSEVLDNFQSMATTVSGARGTNMSGLRFIDARNDNQKKDWFAATVRGSAVGQNHVNVYIGRSFFLAFGGVQDRGHVAGDATVVTLVHELAHAVFSASDVPVAGSGHVLDAHGMPPPGAAVANDAAADAALATASPNLAPLNADNYGQLAFAALEAAGA